MPPDRRRIGIVLPQRALSAYAAAGIGDLIEEASKIGPLAVIAIDIPIGSPDTERRQAGLLARKAVGPRWAPVFMTPVRPALDADDYASATALSLKLAGESISRQASALRANPPGRPWVRQTRHRSSREPGPAGEKAAVDDGLDAALAAWTALRVIRDQARRDPDPPPSSVGHEADQLAHFGH